MRAGGDPEQVRREGRGGRSSGLGLSNVCPLAAVAFGREEHVRLGSRWRIC